MSRLTDQGQQNPNYKTDTHPLSTQDNTSTTLVSALEVARHNIGIIPSFKCVMDAQVPLGITSQQIDNTSTTLVSALEFARHNIGTIPSFKCVIDAQVPLGITSQQIDNTSTTL
eukprot:PhF_6_TR26343/c0_g1_i3/m.37900